MSAGMTGFGPLTCRSPVGELAGDVPVELSTFALWTCLAFPSFKKVV